MIHIPWERTILSLLLSLAFQCPLTETETWFQLSKAFLILKRCFNEIKSRIKQVGPIKFWTELTYTVLHIAFFWHDGVRVISEGRSEAAQSSLQLKAGLMWSLRKAAQGTSAVFHRLVKGWRLHRIFGQLLPLFNS